MLQLSQTLRREQILKISAVGIILLTAAIVIFAVPNLLSSFVFAFVINYLLAPIVNMLERSRVPRGLAIVLPFVCAGLLAVAGAVLLYPLIAAQVSSLEQKFPQYQQDIINLVANTENRFKVFFRFYNVNVSQTLNHWLLEKTGDWSAQLPSLFTRSLTIAMLAPLFAYFMLQDGRRIARNVLTLVPNNLFELVLNLFHQINEQLGGFIRARILEAAIVGLVIWVGLLAFNFPYATLLALFAALTNIIPYVGPILGAVPAMLIVLISPEAMITSSSGVNLAIITSVFFLAQLIDIVFIIPFVVAKIVNLHPVTVIIVIILGAELMGILGMIISIPLASAVKLTVTAIYNHLLELRT